MEPNNIRVSFSDSLKQGIIKTGIFMIFALLIATTYCEKDSAGLSKEISVESKIDHRFQVFDNTRVNAGKDLAIDIL